MGEESRRDVQFWVSILAIGGLLVITCVLIAGLTYISVTGTGTATETSTLRDGTLLAIGGMVGLAGSVGGWLFGRANGTQQPPARPASPPPAPPTGGGT